VVQPPGVVTPRTTPAQPWRVELTKDKSPAFQYYPKDLLTDMNWRRMTYPEKGMYWELVSLCWLDGSIPADIGAIARVLAIDIPTLEDAWINIGRCFQQSTVLDCSKLVHPRLEFERRKQADRRKVCSKGGRNSRGKPKHTLDLTPQQSTNTKRTLKQHTPSASPTATAYNNTYISGKRKASHRVPEDFTITDAMRQWARDENLEADLDSETKVFCDHEFEKAKTDWVATWRNWMRNSKKFQPMLSGRIKPPKKDVLDIMLEKAEMEESNG
jgi:hypothetical protein